MAIGWLLIALSAPAQAPTIQPGDVARGVSLGDRWVLDAEVLGRLPSGGSISTVMAHQFLPVLFAHEETMGFSDIEPERLSIAGNSEMWTEWRLGDFNLTDPLFDGAAAFKVPFAFISAMEVHSAESARQAFGGGVTFDVTPRVGAPTRAASVSLGVGGVGDTMPGAEAITDYFSAAHPRNRVFAPEEQRRHLRSRLKASAMDQWQLSGLALRASAEVDGNTRRHVDFPGTGLEPGIPYDENTFRASGIAELAPADRRWRAYALTEYRQRGNLYTERKFTRAETQRLSSGGLLLGLQTADARAALTLKHDHFDPVVAGFTRELMDLDGEGLFPFIPTGAMNSVRADAGFRFGGFFYLDLDLRLLAWQPGPKVEHPLVYFGVPYGTMTVDSRPTLTWVGAQRLGYRRTFTSGRLELAVDAYGALNHTHAAGARALVLPDLGVELQGVVHVARGFRPFASIGKTPIGLTSELGLTLTPGMMSGTERLTDGRFVRAVGGDLTRLADTLLAPNLYSAAVGFTSLIGQQWMIRFQGLAKVFHGLPRLMLDGAPSDFGYSSGDFFFYDGRPTRYRLESTPWLETPFGGQVQLEVQRFADENSFVNLGFSAANFYGHPPFGNGAYGNDIGLVAWDGANPNARARSFAVTDSDRAFVLKGGAGKRFWRTLWGSFQVLFKDGQPYAFYDHAFSDGQLAMQLHRNRGSPLKISYPLIGSREDFQVMIDLRVSYDVDLTPGWQLKLWVIVANAFDLGNEVNERHSPGNRDFGRSSLELQLPRSVGIGLDLVDRPTPRG